MLKEISDFKGYFISDEGKVFCNLGKGNRRKTDRTVPMYEVKGRPTKNGYLRVYMRSQSTGKRVDRYIHRLVALHFLPNPEQKPCVNHKNCDRTDNRVHNLEWASYKENTDQTFDLKHVVRTAEGKYQSNFNYSLYSLLPRHEKPLTVKQEFQKLQEICRNAG